MLKIVANGSTVISAPPNMTAQDFEAWMDTDENQSSAINAKLQILLIDKTYTIFT